MPDSVYPLQLNFIYSMLLLILVLVAASPSVNALRYGTAAKTFGWGWQDDSLEGRLQPITQLKGLDIRTTACRHFSDRLFWIPLLPDWDDGSPVFFCVTATETGSPCFQDYGGKHLLCHIINYQLS